MLGRECVLCCGRCVREWYVLVCGHLHTALEYVVIGREVVVSSQRSVPGMRLHLVLFNINRISKITHIRHTHIQ